MTSKIFYLVFGLNIFPVYLYQVFLTKHYRNRRKDDPEFVLDFEEIYIIDSKTKSITRAKVVVSNPSVTRVSSRL